MDRRTLLRSCATSTGTALTVPLLGQHSRAASAPTQAWTTTVSRVGSLRGMQAAEGFLVAEYPNEIRSLSQTDGSQRWKRAVPARQYTTTLHDGRLFIERFETVTTVSPGGSDQWQYTHGGQEAVATAYGGSVGAFGTADRLAAVSLADGSMLWRKTSGPTRPVAVQNGVVVARTASGGNPAVAGFDTQGGTTRWSYQPSGPVEKIVQAGDALYLALPDRYVALSVADGSKRWAYQVPTGRRPGVLRLQDLAVVHTGGTVSAVKASGGTFQWAVRLGAPAIPLDAGADLSFFLSAEPAVYAIDATGNVAYSVGLGTFDELTFPQPAAFARNALLVASEGTLRVYDSEGSVVWEQALGTGQAASLGVDGGTAFARDGDMLWAFSLPQTLASTNQGGGGMLLPAVGALLALVAGGGYTAYRWANNTPPQD